MKDLAQAFLSERDRSQIVEAVKKAEKKTAGEIVCLVESASYHYPMADVIGAAALALPSTLLATPLIGGWFWLGTQNMWLFLGLFAIIFAISYYTVKHTIRLKRLFISNREIDEEVEEAAITNFFRHALYRTRDATGVLIYISVFERRVWVLADQGINSKVPRSQWDSVVSRITEGIRKKQAAVAICDAVHMVGRVLEEHFPAKPDDTDELQNMIIGDE